MRHLQNSIFLIALTLICTISTQAQSVIGNGNVIKEKRNITPFTSIETSNGWDIILTQGNTHAMTVEADENFLKYLKTEVTQGVLKIYSKAKMMRHGRNSRSKIYLTFKTLRNITASGGADVSAVTPIVAENFKLKLSGGSDLEKLNLKVKDLQGTFSSGSDAAISFETVQNINIEASGGSDIYLNNIQGENCQLVLRGGSDAILKGNVSQFKVTASGGSDIEAGSFKVNHCKMNLSGSSDATIEVNGEMEVSLSSGSDLNCKGNPKIISQSVCKSCDFSVRR